MKCARTVVAVLTLGLVSTSLATAAESVTTTSKVVTPLQPLAQTPTVWGLSDTQWREYQAIMRDRRGVWSPGLDPITALGVSTDNFDQRRQLAELYVRTEFERTRKELAFQVAVDQAWQRLYPQTPRLAAGRGAAAASVPPVRYAVIVTPGCAECQAFVEKRLEGLLAQASEGVDVHVVATDNDDAQLRAWVANQPAMRAALKNDAKVTVNHGSNFEHLSRFPVLYRKNGAGQWMRLL